MKHRKVYSEFQINIIVFYTVCIMMIPILSMISFIFDIHMVTSINTIFLVSSVILLVVFVLGIIYLLLSRDRYERRLKPSYSREFTFMLIVSGFGILGMGIMWIYLGGPVFYVPHVIVPIFIGIYSFLVLIGNVYFNVRFIRK